MVTAAICVSYFQDHCGPCWSWFLTRVENLEKKTKKKQKKTNRYTKILIIVTAPPIVVYQYGI